MLICFQNILLSAQREIGIEVFAIDSTNLKRIVTVPREIFVLENYI